MGAAQAASIDELDRIAERVLNADTLCDVFASKRTRAKKPRSDDPARFRASDAVV